MNSKTILGFVHNATFESPWSVYGRSGRICHILRNTTCRIYGIIYAVTFCNPRTFLILSHFTFLANRPVHLRLQRAKALRISVSWYFLITILERNHIVVEFAIPESLISPEKIWLTVIINKYSRIYESKACGKRSAYGITPRTCRTISHSHT